MKDSHLPVFGVGPYLIAPIVAISVIAVILTFYNMIPVFDLNQIIITLIGIILIVLAIFVWISAVKKSDIDSNIVKNTLVTTGIYSKVRHPIYAAFLYGVTGLILISNNLYLFVLPVIYWAILSVAMKNTEEKWLIDLYGQDYINYSKKVNRFIPKVK